MTRGKRKTGRKPAAAPEPRNESGASTSAGPSRQRDPAPAAAADGDDDDMDVDEPAPRRRDSRLRDRTTAVDHFTPAAGSVPATGFRRQPNKRKRQPPARFDDSPDRYRRRRCPRCKIMKLRSEFCNEQDYELETCNDCRLRILQQRETNRNLREAERERLLRDLMRKFSTYSC